ncbi:MAG TPA: TIGR01841 family phasin [Rhizobiales bacterium]|nr:TIGR01841 family phasin [Hyphomicrobiales bacterium]
MVKKPESNPFTEMFEKFGKDLKLPNVDVEKMLDSQRKNLEALQKSAAASAAGASALIERQRANIEQALAEVAKVAESYRAGGSPQEFMAKQTELARKSFDTALRNVEEAAEIVRKAGDEAIEVLRRRIRESAEEIRQSFDHDK